MYCFPGLWLHRGILVICRYEVIQIEIQLLKTECTLFRSDTVNKWNWS